MGKWNKIDWYCADCGDYWMTTENCAPCAQLNSWCHCSCRNECKGEQKASGAPSFLALAKCHACGQELKRGTEPCPHFERSGAI